MFQPQVKLFGAIFSPFKSHSLPISEFDRMPWIRERAGEGGIHGRGYREEREGETGCNYILI